MKSTTRALLILATGAATLLGGTTATRADCTGVPPVIQVRTDCGGEVAPSCYTSLETLAAGPGADLWREDPSSPIPGRPGAACPVVIDIGPGTFGQFQCPSGNGHVTLRGSGRTQTILKADYVPVSVVSCEPLFFEDLGVEGKVAVLFQGESSGHWTNVEIVADSTASVSIGYWEQCAPGVAIDQEFVDSRIRATGGPSGTAAGIASACGSIRFEGGEILLDLDDATNPTIGSAAAIEVGPTSSVEVVQSAVRARMSAYVPTPNDNSPAPNELVGVSVARGCTSGCSASFQMSGGIINTSVIAPLGASDAPVDAAALVLGPGSALGAPGAAYIVRASTGGTAPGVPTRLRFEGGNGLATYLWQAGDKPPQAPTETNLLRSEDWQDSYVEIDCTPCGVCDDAGTPGDQTHLMIYQETVCPAEKWLNAVTGDCRNVDVCP